MTASPDPMPGLVVHNVSHHFGAKTALDAVSFSVERGTFCALLGLNGAGKSTLYNVLTRLFKPHTGIVTIAGTNLAEAPRMALAKLGIVFQQPTLDLDLTVQHNMRYYSALHGMRGAKADERITQALDRLGMAERAGEKVRALNGGHRRRMELARAMLHEPDVLLLDEPTVGLDPATRRAITDHVHMLVREKNITVLWATHLVDEIDDSDQLVVLHEGKVVADGITRDVRGGDKLADAFAKMTGGGEN